MKPADVRLLCYATIPREEVFDPFQGYDHNQAVDAKVESVCGSDYQRDTLRETPLPDGCLQPF